MNPNNQTENINFRESYRQQHIGQFYQGWLHLLFTLGFSFSIIYWSIMLLNNVSLGQFLTIPLVFLYANFVEYFAHKGPMHKPNKFIKIIYKRHTKQHHVFFTDQQMQFDSLKDLKAVLFPPVLIVFFFGVFALPVGLLARWIFSENVGYLFIATSLSYFAIYEILHTLYHIRKKSWLFKLPFLKSLRMLHQNHHRLDLMNQYNFNITFPIGDLMFGSYYRDEKNTQNKSS